MDKNMDFEVFQAFKGKGLSEEKLEEVKAFAVSFEEVRAFITKNKELDLEIMVLEEYEAVEILDKIDGFIKTL